MAANANGNPIKMFTELGVFDTEREYQQALWAETIQRERRRQVEKGYSADHDAEQGVDHLLMWAQDYSRRGKPVESSALIDAARGLHAKQMLSLGALRAYITDPGNWSDLDGRRSHLLALLDAAMNRPDSDAP